MRVYVNIYIYIYVVCIIILKSAFMCGHRIIFPGQIVLQCKSRFLYFEGSRSMLAIEADIFFA